ncbi:hypothetical protein [Paracoccus sp. (in: a-proteobacteria)]|uniref:portal protein n=1 Tax=Paracoccus sp. TaxID=267 RepID=UPI003341EBDC
MRPKKLTRSEIGKIVRQGIERATDFVESDIQPRHQKNQRYFDGKCDLKPTDGRSKVVATKCRDAVRQVKPSLLRVFMSTARPVEFVPTGPEDVPAAEQQTAYAQYAFSEANGYKLLYSVFHDALVKAPGIAKVWWDETEETVIEDYSSMPDDQFIAMAADDDATVLEHDQRTEMMETPMGPQEVILHDAKIAWKRTEGRLAMKPIPPEDFFIDDAATCIEDAYICGHSTEGRLGDLIAMGFKWSEVENLGSDDNDDEAETNRRGYTPDDKNESADPSMKPVTIYEAYMKMDIEGAGVPKLYAFILAGKEKKLLSYEMCSDAPFAVFEIDPEPHAFYSRALVDLLIGDQDAGTSMLRGLLDNVHISNNPRAAADENTVNLTDLLDNEIGGVIRTKGSPGDKILPFAVPFTAGTTLPALEYFDQQIEIKTGVSRASLGLNPDAMQSTTAAAVNATVSGAEGQVEVMARNLAEGGMKRLFRLILKIVQQRVSPGQFMRLDGKFIPVDPRSWNAGMDLTVNVGLGTNRREERAMALRETLQNQMALMTQGSPLASWTLIRNTLADILDSAGIHNADRHYAPMDQQTEQAMMQQAAQSQQQAPDPNAAIAQAEVQKAQISAQAKLQSDQAKYQIDAQKAVQADDLARDKMEQDAILKLVEMQRKDAQAEAGVIRQMQAEPR